MLPFRNQIAEYLRHDCLNLDLTDCCYIVVYSDTSKRGPVDKVLMNDPSDDCITVLIDNCGHRDVKIHTSDQSGDGWIVRADAHSPC